MSANGSIRFNNFRMTLPFEIFVRRSGVVVESILSDNSHSLLTLNPVREVVRSPVELFGNHPESIDCAISQEMQCPDRPVAD
jgi:hypothetical protein